MQPSNDAATRPRRKDASASGPGGFELALVRPVPEDAPAISRLIQNNPPLDPNSAYCNLLQCSDFSDSCVLARYGDEIVGWVSGYRLPQSPETFFVWQVAVDKSARGKGLAGRMIEELLDRSEQAAVTHLVTTITPDNRASWSLFNGLAARWGVTIDTQPRFKSDVHFDGAHPTEWQARIGPLPLLKDRASRGDSSK